MTRKNEAVNGMTIGGRAPAAAQALKATAGTDSALEALAKKLAVLKNAILSVSRVDTDEAAAELGAKGRDAVDMGKALDRDRRAITDPIRAVLEVVNNKFGALTKPLGEMADHARTVINEHDERKRKAAEMARWRAQTLLDLEAATDFGVAPWPTLLANWQGRETRGYLDEWEARALARLRERMKDVKREQKKHERAVDKAEAKGEAPPPAPAAPAPAMTAVAPQVGKHIGGTTKVSLRWKYTLLENAAQLLPREYLKIDTAALQRAVDDGVREIPGCVIEQKSQSSL